MITICLQTFNRHYLTADTTGAITATPDGVGDWELFQVFRPDGTMATSINHNDRIALRTYFGKYIMATGGGGGTLGSAPRILGWETFTVEKISGTGAVAHNNRVTLRAFDGTHFIMAVGAGGGEVSCVSTNRREWETFNLHYWNPVLIYIKAYDDDHHYLYLEEAGRSEILARWPRPIWPGIFRLINRTRATGLHAGDAIVIQSYNQTFVSAAAGGGSTVSSNQNRAATFETFTITKPGSGVINFGDQVFFQASDRTHFLMADHGKANVINALATLPREWETFTILDAQNWPLNYSHTPFASRVLYPNHPFSTGISRVTGVKRIVALLYGYTDLQADDSITTGDLRNAISGATRSLKSWLEGNSFGAMTLEGSAFGPFDVPWSYETPMTVEAFYSGVLTKAEHMGFSFRDLDADRDGRVGSEDVVFVLMDCSGRSRTGNRPVHFNFRGISYSGVEITAGLYPRGAPVHGVEQLNRATSLVARELCHVLLDLPDRRFAILPPRGDVDATSVKAIDQAMHQIEFIGSGGSQVRIRSVHGTYWVPDGTTANLLNGDGLAADPNTSFELLPASGGTAIRHLDSIHIRSNALNRFVMANRGGGDTASVAASAASLWETFTIERRSGAGILENGDMVFFKTSNRNPFGEAYYLVTRPFIVPEPPGNPNARHNDRETVEWGWWTAWLFSPPGGGVGGAYDVMDHDRKGLMSAYDRAKKGWISLRILIPQFKAWYVLGPSINAPECFVLWDPLFPEEWYMVENRQNRVHQDEIPSSGLIITWVNENPAYWMNWHRTYDIDQLYPAVISAANPGVPPNAHVQPMLQSSKFYKRSEPGTAFRSGEVVLPRGDGTASRFVLEVITLPGEQMAFCIK